LSRLLVLAAGALLVIAAGCGDDDNGDGDRPETSEESQTTPTGPSVSPGGQIAEPGAIPRPRAGSLGEAAQAAGCEVRHPPIEGQGHVEGSVRYGSNPPTSGDHSPFPAEDGVYPKPPRPEELVHSLEHGRVVIQFDPAVGERVKGGLQALFQEDPYHVILAPSTTDMPYEVAATAWGHLLGCPETNDRVYDAIRAFRDRYRDKGPERVP
jgi:hypothetical protein